jgi:hypothetical protein
MCVVGFSLAMIAVHQGCTSISIAPECPSNMRVGETRPVVANVVNPGAIARYDWQAFPANRGRFANPNAADTTFQALGEGEVIVRLTASDGLYQVISDCSIRVQGFASLAVTLTAEPEVALVNEPVTLTCLSVGMNEAITRDIVQIDGRIVELQEVSEGVVRFEAERVGALEFRCVGENADGDQSEPATLDLTVLGSTNANGNANQNANGNSSQSTNQNRNDNENGADNDNEDETDNENDNGR